MTNKNKVQLIHGLSDFHLAVVEVDNRQEVEFGEVIAVEGAVSVGITPNTNTNPKYADNIQFGTLSSLSDIDATLAMVDVPLSIKTRVFGNKDVNGVLFSNHDDIIKEVALGFRAKTQDGGSRFYWMLKGKPEIIGITHETDGDSVESQDTELNLSFSPLRYNGNWKSELDSKIVTVDEWFEEVVYSEEIAELLTGGIVED